MSESVSQILGQLYSITLTPLSEVADYNHPLVKTVINAIISSELRQNHPDVTDQEIVDSVCFLLRLVNCPQDIRGGLLIEPCTRFLFDSVFNQIGAKSDVFAAIIDAWFHFLKETPQGKNKKSSLYKLPHVKDSPLMRFHIEANRESESLYRAYGYRFHKAIRVCNKNKIASSTLSDYVLSSRDFFTYIPDDIKTLSEHPEALHEEYIDSFVKGYDKVKNKCSDNTPLSERAKQIKNKFLRLLSHADIWPKARISGAEKAESIVEEYPEFTPPDGKVDGKQGNNDIKRTVITSGEKGYEAPPEIELYEIPEDTPDDQPVTSKPPSLGFSWQELINLRSFNFYFDSNFLNLFHYGLIYGAFAENWDESPSSNAIITYLMILIHTGIDHRKLLDLELTGNKIGSEAIGLKMDGGRYYILNPSPVELERPDNNDCLNSSAHTYIPMPDKINTLLPRILKDNHKFAFVYSDIATGENKELNILDIEKFIENRINMKYSQYKISITLSRIERSFMPLYHHRFGLDPLIGCHISGKDHQRIYRSQMHYVHIKHEMLEERYLAAFDLVDKAIRENLDSCIEQSFVPDCKGLPWLKDEREELTLSPQNDNGYGSTIICSSSYHERVLRTLKIGILNEEDLIRRHNFYAIYAYLGLQFSLGLRPRNNPEITWDDYDEQAEIICIRDKQSAKFHEERTLPLPNAMNTILKQMKSGFNKLRAYVALNISPSILREKPSKIFFFVDEEGNIENFTLKGMTQLLKTLKIDDNLPANAPRHHMRNYLYHAGVCNDAADVFMGHQHAGREILNLSSSSSLKDAEDICLPVIEKMLGEIRFEGLTYLPDEALNVD